MEKPAKTDARRVLLAGLLLAVGYAALVNMPAAPRPYGIGLDPSWALGLNLAHAQKLIAGRDFVFTYGPLGYLAYPEPDSGPPMVPLLYRAGLFAILAAALCRLAFILPSRLAALGSILILALAAAFNPLREAEQLISTIMVLAVLTLADPSRWRSWEQALLAMLAGLAVMVKLNDGAEAAAILVALLITIRRSVIFTLSIFAATALLLFAASTGSLSGIPAYVRYGWEIVSGYSEGLGLPGPLWQAALAGATLALAFVGTFAIVGDRRALLPGLAPALVVAWFSFKHAIVRQDAGHAAAFHAQLAVALLFLLVCARTPGDRRWILILQLFSITLGLAISMQTVPTFEDTVRKRLELRLAMDSWSALRHWRATWAQVAAANEHDRARLRLPGSFHQIIENGTVDAIPWEIDLVQANAWEWRPRPVFQSYNAYTPALDRLDAAHLESPRAADFAIVDFGAADYHHPFLETPASWRALLNRNDLRLAASGYLLLQRRAMARFQPPVSLGWLSIGWDEDVLVPQSGDPLILSAHIRSTVAGKLANVLFRPAPVFVDVIYSNGKKLHWRCVPSNLSQGFPVRPFPRNLQEVEPLFGNESWSDPPDHIVSMRFHTDRRGQFADAIPLQWSRWPLQGKP